MSATKTPVTEEEIDKILPTISADELAAFSVEDLINRMDTIIEIGNRQLCYYTPMIGVRGHRVGDLMNTASIREMPEAAKRAFAKIAFDFLLQERSLGLVTISPFASKYPQRSPLIAMMVFEDRQRRIIASRIIMELFIELLYFSTNRQRIKEKKNSKMRAFRDWITNVDNPFHYFANVLVEAYVHDRERRTPEIHGTSRLSQYVLRLDNPTPAEQQEMGDLSYALLNVWEPLKTILDGKRPNGMVVLPRSKRWYEAYEFMPPNERKKVLDKMFHALA